MHKDWDIVETLNPNKGATLKIKKKHEETLCVKFGIYMHQMTILTSNDHFFGGGILDNCPTYTLVTYHVNPKLTLS